MMLECVPLSALAEVRSGGGAPQDPHAFTSTGHPFVRAGSLPKLLEGASEESLERLEPATAEKHGLSLFPAGTVLFAKSGMSATKGHVYRLRLPAYVVNHLAALVPHDADDSAFLVRVLQRFPPTVLIKDPAYPSIRLGDIENMKVLAPPDSAGRRRIAEVLDRAEALRAKRRAALAQLDTLTQSLFLDLFGDPVRNEKGWPIAKVSEICELVRGSSPRPQGDPRFFGGCVPRLMVADITRDGWLVTPRIDSLTVEGAKRSRPVTCGTVVMAVSGNVGLVSRLAIDACVHDGFVAFTQLDESRCEPGFLLATLHFSKALHDKHKAGAIFIKLTTTDIKAMQLPLPPLPFQREFSRRVTAVENLKATHRASLAELDALFAVLQYRVFRGEL